MEIPLIQMKDAITKILKGIDPDVDVFYEEIKTVQETEVPETYYFVEIIPNGNETVDQFFTDMGVLVDIAYHEKKESNTAYLIKAAEIDGAIRPVLCFGERRITISNMKSKVSDHVLHCTFPVTFREKRNWPEENNMMESLEAAIKKE